MYTSKRSVKSSKREANVNVKDTDVEKMMNAIWDIMLHNDKSGTCSLTGVHYDNYGNNAYPFEGRCCDEANSKYVTSARMLGMTPMYIKRQGKQATMKQIDDYLKMGMVERLKLFYKIRTATEDDKENRYKVSFNIDDMISKIQKTA